MAKRLTKALAIVLAALCILSTSIFSFAAATDAQLMAKAVDAINSTYGTSYTVKGVRFSQIGRPEVEEDPGPNYGRLLYEVEFSVKDGNTYYDCDVEIDADTGDVVKAVREIDDNAMGDNLFSRIIMLLTEIVESFVSLIRGFMVK